MGDKTSAKEKVTDGDTDSGSSLKPLRTVRPSENISILDAASPPQSQERVQKIHEIPHDEEPLPAVKSKGKVETFFEKPLEPSYSENKTLVQKTATKLLEVSKTEELKPVQSLDETKSIEETSKSRTLDKKPRVGSATSGLIQSERIVRNQSDIFSLKEQTSVTTAIFSINGSPSRKVYRRKDVVASNVFPFGSIGKEEEPPAEKIKEPPRSSTRDKDYYIEQKRPSNSARNPLTGTGLSSNDEYKFKGAKRKDGNPLLGLGYSPEATPSTHRIPPGGYSHKLW
ncbi:hypothetical protein NQ315_005291 [Exocentrus adspersus]|uniref:Microtubule-associated protein Jupiter n=1 Tax=Exocentrus adspersus TaxID=1586481 RepID=A0AAV8W1K1_9CUCU|nr:hypothetical protein NQ315_005291 [Exocentrus adspersus]